MAIAAAIERGIDRVGPLASSPNEPAASKPAKDRKPAVAASATVESEVPGGSLTKSAFTPWPCGEPPKTSLAKMTTTSAMIATTASSSKESSELVVTRTSREASSQISAQPTSATGSHDGLDEMAVTLRKATPKTANAAIDTAGDTREVPSSAQPATKPA